MTLPEAVGLEKAQPVGTMLICEDYSCWTKINEHDWQNYRRGIIVSAYSVAQYLREFEGGYGLY